MGTDGLSTFKRDGVPTHEHQLPDGLPEVDLNFQKGERLSIDRLINGANYISPGLSETSQIKREALKEALRKALDDYVQAPTSGNVAKGLSTEPSADSLDPIVPLPAPPEVELSTLEDDSVLVNLKEEDPLETVGQEGAMVSFIDDDKERHPVNTLDSIAPEAPEEETHSLIQKIENATTPKKDNSAPIPGNDGALNFGARKQRILPKNLQPAHLSLPLLGGTVGDEVDINLDEVYEFEAPLGEAMERQDKEQGIAKLGDIDLDVDVEVDAADPSSSQPGVNLPIISSGDDDDFNLLLEEDAGASQTGTDLRIVSSQDDMSALVTQKDLDADEAKAPVGARSKVVQRGDKPSLWRRIFKGSRAAL